MSILKALTEFANETSIIGIKEIFIRDAALGLRAIWVILLAISASLMIRQSISSCVAYSNEATVTNVRAKEVKLEYPGVINTCLDIDMLIRTNNLSIITSEDGSSLGSLYAAAGIMSKNPHIWLQFNDSSDSEIIELAQFNKVQVKHAIMDTNYTFTQRLMSVISKLGVVVVFLDNDEIIGINGINKGTLCFIKQFPIPLPSGGSILVMNYNKSAVVHLSTGFYSVFADNPFQEDTDALHVFSRSAKILYPVLFPPTELIHSTISKLQLKVQEFSTPNLRRRPCKALDPDIFLPAGRANQGCIQSCLLRLFTKPFNCRFERHLDVTGTHAEDLAKCHWFEILDLYRKDLEKICARQPHTRGIKICSENRTITEWTDKLIDMTTDDMYKNKNTCMKECGNFKSCREWSVTIDTRTMGLSLPETVLQERIMIIVRAPYIITTYVETLQTSLEALVGNVGGIFGFYFGFSIMSVFQIAFFILQRYFNKKNKLFDLTRSVSAA